MSETVMVALITFLASLSGSVVGAIAHYKSASINVKAEQGRLLYNEKKLAYSEFISAYLTVIEHLADVEVGLSTIQSQKTVDALHQFFGVYSKVKLLAPRNVQELIKAAGEQISRSVKECEFPKDSEIFDSLAEAMRKDLYSFSVEENKKCWLRR